MATFTQAIRYTVTATCITPLRNGGSDKNTESILQYPDGQAYLQGTSLTGAMRDWATICVPPEQVYALFGSNAGAGSLIISDGVFSENAEIQTRPHVRIDGATGAAVYGGKFDIAHIAAGTELTFELNWAPITNKATDDAADKEVECVEQILAALHNGEILLGAQKTNGFGRVKLRVKKREYNFYDEQDRIAWLTDAEDGKDFLLPCLQHKKALTTFTVRGKLNSILVRGATPIQEEKGSFIQNLRENDKPIIPGSSIKGVICARAKAIAQLLNIPPEITDDIFGRASLDDDNGKAGHIYFEDAYLSDQKQRVTRIRIDRFTGGVMRGGIFREEPLSSEVTLKITALEE